MKQETNFKDEEKIKETKEIKELKKIIKTIKQKYPSAINEINNIIKDYEREEEIPITIFSKKQPPLVIIVNYLLLRGLTTKEIAKKLNRDYKTIYQAAKKNKNYKEEKNNENKIYKAEETIPITIFSKRKFSIMESLVKYLHEERSMRFTEIARITKKDPRTIWTCWNRARIKINDKK